MTEAASGTAPETAPAPAPEATPGPGAPGDVAALAGRRLIHVTTADISLALLLGPQLQAFAAAGMEVIGASAPGPFVERLESWGVRHVALEHATRSVAPGYDLLAAPELYRLFRRLRPDIVHTHNPKPGVYGRAAAARACVPAVLNTVHGLYVSPDSAWWKRVVVYGLERAALTCSDRELVQNAEDVATLRRIGVPADKVTLLGNGVDLQRFTPARDPASRAAARAELGVTGDDAVVVGTVGRLVWQKGFRELFAAAAALRTWRPEIVFVVVGPVDPAKGDALAPDDIAEAETLGNVVFTGHRDDVEALYPGFDVFVLPSHREGFPRAAMEAAASGSPSSPPTSADAGRSWRPARPGCSPRSATSTRSPTRWPSWRSTPRVGSGWARRRGESGGGVRRPCRDPADPGRVRPRAGGDFSALGGWRSGGAGGAAYDGAARAGARSSARGLATGARPLAAALAPAVASTTSRMRSRAAEPVPVEVELLGGVDQLLAQVELGEESPAVGRELVGVVGQQQLDPVLGAVALGSERRRHAREAVGERLEDLQARAAAVAERHHGDIGLGQLRLHVGARPDHGDLRWMVQALDARRGLADEAHLHLGEPAADPRRSSSTNHWAASMLGG